MGAKVHGLSHKHKYSKKLHGRDIKLLGDYTNANTKTLHQCLKCGKEWEITPGSVVAGHGCSYCNKLKITRFEYECRLSETTWILKDDFVYQKKMWHQCKSCKNMSYRYPQQIHDGCQKCANNRSAQEIYKNNPTWLYYVAMPNENVYKIGVAMDKWGGTLGRYSKKSCPNVDIITERLFEDGYEAYKLEQTIIDLFADKAWKPKDSEKFDGWTECFTEDVFKEFH